MAVTGCSCTELKARIVKFESDLQALRDVLTERDIRYTQRALGQDNAVAAALATSKEAVAKAEVATEKRLEVLNELRGVVVDQSREFARKPELHLLIDGLTARIDTVTQQMIANREHGGGVKDAVGYAVGFIGLAIAGLAVYLHH